MSGLPTVDKGWGHVGDRASSPWPVCGTCAMLARPLARPPALLAVGCSHLEGAGYISHPLASRGSPRGDEMGKPGGGWQATRVHVGGMAWAWGHGVAETAGS